MSMKLAVIDFGSTYTAFLHQSLQKLGYDYTEFEVTQDNSQGQEVLNALQKTSWGGIILSGSRDNLYNSDARQLPREFLGYIVQNRIPTLGICYGHQLFAHLSVGGKIALNPEGMEKGSYSFIQDEPEFPLFKGLPRKFKVNMHHFDIIETLPSGFRNFGHSKRTKYGAIQLSQNGETFPIFGIQFHPEKSNRKVKRAIFTNFYNICTGMR